MIPTVLVVDDDAAFRELVVDILRPEGYRLLEAGSGEEALRTASREAPDLVITDQRMPGLDGLELTRRLRASSHPPAVLLLTAYGTIPQAVEAVHLGAADYLTKPLESPEALRRAVRGVFGRSAGRPVAEEEFLTRDPATLEMLALADRAAATDATVLVTGGSGTGKELVARRIHRKSRRAGRPFVVVNCAALPESLAESELFGHEKGSFTGAIGRHAGRFEQAQGGTLFLDEVGELSEAVQAKLLRALEQRTIERIGGTQSIPLDIRLVAATNRNLEERVTAGALRADLFYRLNVVSLHVPPLRERAVDLPVLVSVLTESLARQLGLPPRRVGREALEALRRYSWPGNVRELRNVLERALIAARGETILAEDLPPLLSPPEPEIPFSAPAEAVLSLGERERQAILEALARTGGHRERAARVLGVSVRTLYNRLKQYGIE
ncbi:MAG TPA: sigma-54 dependent transcriptional regulator [Thermoanaerobaculia bacterium]|nr:sigma-54 dependent transcriptional regulator [Thermoanaerobaculia bacterium]